MADDSIDLPGLHIGPDGLRIRSACPTCGLVEMRTAYDIGSGPELSCTNCEWCWGATGQPLKPLDVDAIHQEIKEVRARDTN